MATAHKHKTEISALNDIAQLLADNTTAIENIELSIDNIEVDADTINLNTDTLETKLDTINTTLSAASAAAVTSLSISSTSTAFVNSTGVDLDAYSTISFVPNVTVNAGTNAYYRIQWSFDNSNWFDETIDEAGTIAATESAITQGTMIRSVLSAATGYKPLSAITLTKRARYIRVSQRSDAAVTITTTYAYQLLK